MRLWRLGLGLETREVLPDIASRLGGIFARKIQHWKLGNVESGDVWIGVPYGRHGFGLEGSSHRNGDLNGEQG